MYASVPPKLSPQSSGLANAFAMPGIGRGAGDRRLQDLDPLADLARGQPRGEARVGLRGRARVVAGLDAAVDHGGSGGDDEQHRESSQIGA